MYGKGISKVGELLDIAIATDIIKQAGSWFSMGEKRLGQGRENIRKMIEEDDDLFEEIRAKVMELDALPEGENDKQYDDAIAALEGKTISGSMGIVSPAEPSPGRMTSSLDCFPSRMVVSIPVLAPARPGYWDAGVTVRVVGSKTDSEVRRTPDLCDVSWWTPVILPRSTGSSSPNPMRESSIQSRC